MMRLDELRTGRGRELPFGGSLIAVLGGRPTEKFRLLYL